MSLHQSDETIASAPVPACYLCGTAGQTLYHGLRDRFFGAPGTWHLKRCPAPDCRLIWLDPMPTEDEVAKAYPQTYYTHGRGPVAPATWLHRLDRRVARAYIAQRYRYDRESLPAWQRALAFLAYLYPDRRADYDWSVMYLPARLRGRLLDVGCGSGQVLEAMERLGWDAVGVDVDRAAVERAQSKGLRAAVGTLETQGYPDNHFDAITMNHVIEHVHDPLGLLRECHRTLAPGGQLVIVTPNGESWGHRLFKASWFPLDPPRHLYLFSRRTLGTLAGRAGLRAFTLSTTIHHAPRLFIASMFIRRSGHVLHHPSLSLKIWARGMQMAEWALLRIRPDSGEEILLQARKEPLP